MNIGWSSSSDARIARKSSDKFDCNALNNVAPSSVRSVWVTLITHLILQFCTCRLTIKNLTRWSINFPLEIRSPPSRTLITSMGGDLGRNCGRRSPKVWGGGVAHAYVPKYLEDYFGKRSFRNLGRNDTIAKWFLAPPPKQAQGQVSTYDNVPELQKSATVYYSINIISID